MWSQCGGFHERAARAPSGDQRGVRHGVDARALLLTLGFFFFFFSHCPCLFPPVVCLSASPSLCAPAGVSLSPLRPRRCSWSGLWDGGVWDAGSDGLGLGLLHTLNPNRPRPAASRASLTACPSLSLPGAGLPLTHLEELSRSTASSGPGATGSAEHRCGCESAWLSLAPGDRGGRGPSSFCHFCWLPVESGPSHDCLRGLKNCSQGSVSPPGQGPVPPRAVPRACPWNCRLPASCFTAALSPPPTSGPAPPSALPPGHMRATRGGWHHEPGRTAWLSENWGRFGSKAVPSPEGPASRAAVGPHSSFWLSDQQVLWLLSVTE